MPSYRYSIQTDPDRTARAAARDIDISIKAAREVCKVIKGMTIHKCIDYLEAVIDKKQVVPFRRYKKKVGHKSSLSGFPAGRYPVKAASEILKVVKNLENNAENKQLQVDKCVIIHAAALQGTKEKGIFYRAHGSSSPKIRQLVHIELIAEVRE